MRGELERLIKQGLKQCIHDHGDINKNHLGSASKRIASRILKGETFIQISDKRDLVQQKRGESVSEWGDAKMDVEGCSSTRIDPDLQAPHRDTPPNGGVGSEACDVLREEGNNHKKGEAMNQHEPDQIDMMPEHELRDSLRQVKAYNEGRTAYAVYIGSHLQGWFTSESAALEAVDDLADQDGITGTCRPVRICEVVE